MSTEIVVPELGESIVEATVGEWRVAEGQAVKVGDVVVELETDKVDVEVGATAAGVLTRILHPTGSDVAIGDVLGVIGGAGEQGSGGAGEQDSTASVAPPDSPTPVAQTASLPTAATPVARRMAEAEGIDLGDVARSGAGGRVTKQDVAARLAPPTATAESSTEGADSLRATRPRPTAPPAP